MTTSKKTPKKAKPKADQKSARGRGRPTDYKPEYDEQSFKLCLLGATDVQLADFFHTSEQTINAWKQAQPKFLEAIKAGKDQADAEVAKSLYHRALGYEHDEDKIFNDNGNPMIVPTIRHYPPDPTACIFWLKNRKPENWREKQEHTLSNPDGGPVKILVEFVGDKP